MTRKQAEVKRIASVDPCHYLLNSAEAFKMAIDTYNTGRYGSVETSLSLLIKAWNTLFLANKALLAHQYLYNIEKIEALPRKGTRNSWRRGATESSLMKQTGSDYNYALETYVKQIEAIWKEDRKPSNGNRTSIEDALFQARTHPSFEPSKLDQLFFNFTRKHSPERMNWNIIYGLRNFDQHDYLELHSDYGYTGLVHYLNPYVASSCLNYLNGYKNLHEKIVKFCKSVRHDSGVCVRTPLRELSPQTLHGYTHLPYGLSALEAFSSDSLLETARPSVRKIAEKLITEQVGQAREVMKDQRFKIPSLEVSPPLSKSAVERVFSQVEQRYCYPTLNAVAESLREDLDEDQGLIRKRLEDFKRALVDGSIESGSRHLPHGMEPFFVRLPYNRSDRYSKQFRVKARDWLIEEGLRPD